MRKNKHNVLPREYKPNNKRPSRTTNSVVKIQFDKVPYEALPSDIRDDLKALCFEQRDLTVYQDTKNPNNFNIRFIVQDRDDVPRQAHLRIRDNEFRDVNYANIRPIDIREALEMYARYKKII